MLEAGTCQSADCHYYRARLPHPCGEPVRLACRNPIKPSQARLPISGVTDVYYAGARLISILVRSAQEQLATSPGLLALVDVATSGERQSGALLLAGVALTEELAASPCLIRRPTINCVFLANPRLNWIFAIYYTLKMSQCLPLEQLHNDRAERI